ncbi:MAG: prepilin-type N-terminal cleavage/methylation domain-containing protein [Pseudanabaenaceae cyanobacterium]
MKLWQMLFQLGRKPAARPVPKGAAGFTLIEVLVALLIGSLIISSLLFVLVRFLDASRREEAKVATQEELQAALDFIADDLQEAVYIYNADGIERDSTQNPPGIRDQLPHVTNSNDLCPGPTASPADRRCIPVLVFWKRKIYPADEGLPQNDSPGAPPSEDPRLGGCTEFSSNPSDPEDKCGDPPKGTDKFTYSLVAYYISRGGNTLATPPRTARLLRWELKGGIPWSCALDPSPTAFQNAAKCPIDTTRRERVDRNGDNVTTAALTTPVVSPLYPDLRDSTIYAMRPDPGFVSPTSVIASTFGTLGQRLNRWRRFQNYDTTAAPVEPLTPYQVLIDFLDDTVYEPRQDDGVPPDLVQGLVSSPTPDDVFETGIRPNTKAPAGNLADASQQNDDCSDPDRGVGRTDPNLEFPQRVPSTFVSGSGLSSFYVCVNSARNAVRVYLRGNAWARVVGGKRESRLPRANLESFFITQNVRAFGRGVLNVK